MAIGLSFLTPLVWNVFYGLSANDLGPVTYRLLVFIAFATTMFSASMTIAQLLKEYKLVVIGLITGFLLKLCLNIPMMHLFNAIGLYPFYGAISTSILSFIIISTLVLIIITRKYKISLRHAGKVSKNLFIGIFLMLLFMSIMTIVIPFNLSNRFMSLLIAVLYAGVGGSIYAGYMYYTKTVHDIFGKDNIERIMNKILRKNK